MQRVQRIGADRWDRPACFGGKAAVLTEGAANVVDMLIVKDREKADYDGGWRLVETDVIDAIRLLEEVFAKWREIKDEEIARNHLLSMFGARSD